MSQHIYLHCPSCNRERATLAVFPTSSHCHACGYHTTIGWEELTTMDITTMNTPAKSNTIILPTTDSFDWVSKAVPSNVLDLYGVGVDSIGRIVSPHYSPDMQLMAYHTRTPGHRDFRTHGVNCPIGLHTLNNNKTLIICEGHTDVYSAKTMFPESDVIGVPGSDTVPCLKSYISKLRKYKRITVMCDGDAAGRKCADAIVALLPTSKTYRAHLAEGMDVSDYLTSKRVDDLLQLHKLATANKSSSFVDDDDCDMYASSVEVDRISTGIPSVDELLDGGFDSPSLNVVVGSTGIGKSAFVQNIAVNVAKRGVKVMYLAGEMTPKQTLDRLVVQWYGHKPMTPEQKAEYGKEVSRAIKITKFSSITLANVVDKMEEAVLDHDVRLVIVDVLSDIDKFLSDYKDAAIIMKAIHHAAKGSEEVPSCAVLSVCHTKGTDEGRVTMDKIRGGSTIKQEATCILAFDEVEQGNRNCTDRYIKVLKQRAVTEVDLPQETMISYRRVGQLYHDSPSYTAHSPAEVELFTPPTQEEQETHVRLISRRKLPQGTSGTPIPPTTEVPLRVCTTNEGVPSTTESAIPDTEGTIITDDTQLQPGLLLSTDGHVHRDKGDTTDSRPTEDTTGIDTSSAKQIQVSNSTDDEQVPAVTETPTTTTKRTLTVREHELNALRRMYQGYPDILRQHTTESYKTNHLIRDNLIALGIATT